MGLGGGSVIYCCFKTNDARTCLNTNSLDPGHTEREIETTQTGGNSC